MCYKNEYQKRAHGEVEQIFRELLPKAGLHVREEQIRLCHEMLDALMKNEITLCDAGVGIGKTYAYLTACILMRKYSVLHSGYSGCDRRSVVVSTSSIALQKAIIEEYVPFLSDVLLKADLLQGELKAVVRKGKEHFVCDYRLAQRLEAVRDKNKNQAQMEALKSLRHNFDLDSVHNLSGFDRRLVCVPKFCPRECPGKAGCRYQKHLDISRKEDIFLQICNHNYLLADAMHRANGYRPLLADYRALVVDEAHKLPEAASQMYGRSIGREDVQEIAYFLVREHKGTDGKRLLEGVSALQMEIRKHRKDGIEDMAGKESFYFPPGAGTALAQMQERLQLMIKRLAGNIPYWIFRRMEEMEELFGWFLKNDKRYILFLQQDSRGHLTFMAVNREIPKYLDATLWNRGFVDANGKYYELWNAQAQYYTE